MDKQTDFTSFLRRSRLQHTTKHLLTIQAPDTRYRRIPSQLPTTQDGGPRRLIELATAGRVLLTRDKKLMSRREPVAAVLIEDADPRRQLAQASRNLSPSRCFLTPFVRAAGHLRVFSGLEMVGTIHPQVIDHFGIAFNTGRLLSRCCACNGVVCVERTPEEVSADPSVPKHVRETVREFWACDRRAGAGTSQDSLTSSAVIRHSFSRCVPQPAAW